jgi:hypothetical protein
MQIIKDWKIEIEKHISAIDTFLGKTKKLHKNYTERNKNKTEIGFNVFTISSDFYYRENFHSDIVKSFLNPQEKHNEGSKYLHTFIDLINKKNNQIEIQKKDFENSIVEREKHNIDILITDEYSKKAIIIENKINNAVDQQRQLPRYVDIVKKEFEIVAIVYLTLNSSKRPDKNDWSKEELKIINPILKLIPAFEIDPSKPNLFNNWIIPSIINSKNIDSTYLLRQYGSLIKYLNTNTMDTISLEKFYNSAKENNNLETAISVRNMLNDFPEYLAIRIEERYKENCHPFKKIWRYQKRDTVFEGCEINELYFKLDIWCDVNGYTVHFRETKNSDYNISTEYKEKLEILSDFKIHNNEINNIKKHFNIFEEETLFEFIDKLLIELKKR